MAKAVTKLFKRPEDAETAVSELKSRGYEAKVIDQGGENELEGLDLPEQALNYYKIGLAVGGKIVRVDADEQKAEEVNKVLISAGFEELTERPAQWASSPGFTRAPRMAGTNPIDAAMTGDFRKY
ncbi:MAG: hypothetical protein R6U89_03380 [Dehalococcoidia bacterium]